MVPQKFLIVSSQIHSDYAVFNNVHGRERYNWYKVNFVRENRLLNSFGSFF